MYDYPDVNSDENSVKMGEENTKSQNLGYLAPINRADQDEGHNEGHGHNDSMDSTGKEEAEYANKAT